MCPLPATSLAQIFDDIGAALAQLLARDGQNRPKLPQSGAIAQE